MSYLIEKDGERQFVKNLDGYDDWIVVAQGAAAKPKPNADFINGAWVVDAQRRTAAERRARFQAMTREELVDFILDIIKRGDERLDALEADVEALKALPPAPTG